MFREPRKRIVAHTASSKALAELSVVRDFASMVCEEMWQNHSRGFRAHEQNHSIGDRRAIEIATIAGAKSQSNAALLYVQMADNDDEEFACALRMEQGTR